MFRWNMSLETGLTDIDHGRHVLVEALSDYFEIIDMPSLNQKLVAERTGAIYTAMKAAFRVEDALLTSHGEAGVKHQAVHAAFLLSYVDLCKKLVPKIKTLKQAQQACLEIYRLVDIGVYHHLTDEAVAYKHMIRHPPTGDGAITSAKTGS